MPMRVSLPRGTTVKVSSLPTDTTSILATIEARFHLAPLTSRDASVNSLARLFGPH